MNRWHFNTHTAIILAAGLILTGCSGDRVTLEENIEEQAQRIHQLETELEKVRASHVRESESLREELAEAHQRELDDLGSTLRRQVNEHSRTIADLREQLARTKQPLPSATPVPIEKTPLPPVAAGPTISVYTPPPPPNAYEFLVPPSDPRADPFPVQVDAVQGERVVIGSHTSTRIVETKELVKNEFGDEKPLLRPETIEIEDYDHQARFTAYNRTRSPITLTYRAGRNSETVTLESDETRECRVPSQVGASLTVQVGSDTRTFRVSYP